MPNTFLSGSCDRLHESPWSPAQCLMKFPVILGAQGYSVDISELNIR